MKAMSLTFLKILYVSFLIQNNVNLPFSSCMTRVGVNFHKWIRMICRSLKRPTDICYLYRVDSVNMLCQVKFKYLFLGRWKWPLIHSRSIFSIWGKTPFFVLEKRGPSAVAITTLHWSFLCIITCGPHNLRCTRQKCDRFSGEWPEAQIIEMICTHLQSPIAFRICSHILPSSRQPSVLGIPSFIKAMEVYFILCHCSI